MHKCCIYVFLLMVLHEAQQMDNPTINLNGCTFIGKWSNNNEIASFLSIPFAQPPIKELRWTNPILMTNYNTNTYNSTYYHSRCFQPWDQLDIKEYPPQSEDCLTLDIYMPWNSKNTSIMIFIYGGSSVIGSSFQYNFTNFSKMTNKIIIVPNYRVGILGYLSFTALSEISATNTSGNYGIMDIITSIKWINKYIDNFNGNSNNITIFGQSTGCTMIYALLMTPLLKHDNNNKYFHRAICMSGSPNVTMDSYTANEQGNKWLNTFKCDNNTNEMIVECMRNIDPYILSTSIAIYEYQLLKMMGMPGPDPMGSHLPGLIIVDGYVIIESFENAIINGNILDIPLIWGNMQYECDYLPFRNVLNYSAVEFGDFIDEHFMLWGKGFGQNLWHKYYENDYILNGTQLVYNGICADCNTFCGTKYLSKLLSDSKYFNSNIYIYNIQQWPSHQYIASDTWNATNAFHGFDLFSICDVWNSWIYLGSKYFKPESIDLKFGDLLRKQWMHFIEYNKPLSNWPIYHENTNYSVALFGGYNSSYDYDKVVISYDYKISVCQFYLDHGIDQRFWWAD
eukprot:478787_1